MIRSGFLTREDRVDLTALARAGSAEHRLARRANTALPVERRVNRQDGRLRKGEFAPLPTPDRRFYLVGVWRRV